MRRALAALAVAALGALGLPALAAAQAPPLTATLVFAPPVPANRAYDATSPATPLGLVITLANTSGAPVYTTQGFAKSEFWRRLYFTDPNGGLVINAAEATIHGVGEQVFHCFSRGGILQRPTAIPVVPVEILPSSFALQYTIPDARTHFALTTAGRWEVNARIPLLVFTQPNDPAAIITDCDQFPGQTLVNVAGGVPSSRGFTVLSNGLEFTIVSDNLPPTTVAAVSPAPNAAGWDRTNVTVTLTSTDNPGGSGVSQIVVTTTGAQTGTTTLSAANGTLAVTTQNGSSVGTGTVAITAEGTTTVRYHGVDAQGNVEVDHTLTVKIDGSAPRLTCVASPATLWPPTEKLVPVTVAVSLTDGGSGPAGFVLSSITSNSNRRPKPGEPDIVGFTVGQPSTQGQLRARKNEGDLPRIYTLTYAGNDVAGNTATCTTTVTVPHDRDKDDRDNKDNKDKGKK
ncbi:MAG: hypothetical protein HY216_07320 [Candidatus Rokubacteria bacterium]|nr:hypothetical protein [Candidatus Rokubacteria bacterium]